MTLFICAITLILFNLKEDDIYIEIIKLKVLPYTMISRFLAFFDLKFDLVIFFWYKDVNDLPQKIRLLFYCIGILFLHYKAVH